VTAYERREELKRIMTMRRRDTIENLATELGVSPRTIERDIDMLSSSFPLITIQGNGGGVQLMDHYHPYGRVLTRHQVETLQNLMSKASDEERADIEQMLSELTGY